LPHHRLCHGLIRFGQRRLPDLRESEIQELDALPCGQNIRGLQIAMHDALFVRGIQSIQDLPRIFEGLGERQRSFERSPSTSSITR
jgi:hypothetical protein